MFSKSYCAAIEGITGCTIQIEADISDGLPNFSLVGYLSSQVKEARERVWIAMKNSGFRFPSKKVTINLSPADIRKEGTSYDLAIAMAILSAYGYIPLDSISHCVFIGELSLDGNIKAVNGVLPMVYTALENGFTHCIVPSDNLEEGQVVKGIHVIGVSQLKEVCEMLSQGTMPENVRSTGRICREEESLPDFSDVRGQQAVVRAAMVAVSGMHNFLMIGPPGSGKTMIAKRIAGIMPEMSFDEQMEISKVYSVAGLLSKEKPLVYHRPFRAPHHTITQTALTGGGRFPMPGEISLASGGVLFLDELPEFNRASIEVLRQPLEEGVVRINRLNGSCTYPANSLLLAAMNPCRCGFYPDKTRCHCSPLQIQNYLGKISRPLLDRIDICTETIPLKYQEIQLDTTETSVSTQEIRRKVTRAHEIQKNRYEKENFRFNSQLTPKKIKKYCKLTKDAKEYLKDIFDQMEFSARAYHKILKVSRTIADLEGEENISKSHIIEAVCYRSLDKKYWGVEES